MKKREDGEKPAQGVQGESANDGAPAAAGPEGTPRESEVALREERDLLKEQLARALADMQNLRRRQVKELEDGRKRAVESLARELLPVLDNFQFALAAHDHQDPSQTTASRSIVEGLQMVRALLEGALERHGVREITAVGTPFDPAQHEAVGLAPAGKHPPGTVVDVLQRGFALGDKVLRASKVVVAPEASPKEGSSKERDAEDA